MPTLRTVAKEDMMAHHGDGDGQVPADVLKKMFGQKGSDNLETAEEVARRKLAQLGATGEYPEGKLNPDDEGELKMAVGTEGGRVVMKFGKPVAWIGFTDAQAREIAALLCKHADSLKP